ncbi:MAG: peptidylprolyl isomerase [Frankia sp.]|nr:peptidylprolyl isomerase [Frankia sp.]
MSKSRRRRRRELALAKAARQAERRRAAQRRRRRIAIIATVAILAVLAGTISAIVLTSGGDDGEPVAEPTVSLTPTAPPETTQVGECVYTKDSQGPAREVTLPPSADTVDTNPATMTINTTAGTMVATLDAAKAPCTVHAFVHLAQAKFFDDTPCHRETGGEGATIFVLQCGDPTGTGSGGPGFTYRNENTEGVNYNRGVIAMANSGPDTNGSQFFINYADPTEDGAANLAGNYTVFGQITEGLDVLDALTSPGIEGGGPDGAPASKAHITSITITQQ